MPFLVKIFTFFLAILQSLSVFFTGNNLKQVIFLNSDTVYQTFEGFGTSSCWWSQNIFSAQQAKETAGLLYSGDGLNLNIYRYNIGAGEKDNPASRIGDYSRRTESFLVYNAASGTYEYDFTRDENARRQLDAAVNAGADSIILFCNSPHYSMTASGHASGGLTENASNLPEENYQAFVDYVLTIADWFVSQGYPVTAVSPINEPQWKWGGDWVGQEGCHYTPEQAVRLLELFAVNMQERHSPYALRGPESGQMSAEYRKYLDKFFESPVLSEFCDTFSGHSYWMDGDTAGKTAEGAYFAEKFPGKKYEMSEWCELPLKLDSDSIESGLYMANTIADDLNLMNAVSWQSWTAVNGDGLMDITDSGLHLYYRYYAYRQFSAFISPGMKRIKVSDSFLTENELKYTAFSDGTKTVLVIINNTDSVKPVSIAGCRAQTEIYETSANHKCEQIFSGSDSGRISLPGQSITTVILR